MSRITVAVFSIVAYILCGSVQNLPTRNSPHRAIDSVEAKAKKGRLHTIDSLRLELAHHPSNMEARLHLANVLQDDEKWSESIREYQIYLGFAPNDVCARSDYGRTLWSNGNIALAKMEFDTVLTIDPEHVNTLISMGELLEEQIDSLNSKSLSPEFKSFATKAHTYFERAKASALKRDTVQVENIDALLQKLDKYIKIAPVIDSLNHELMKEPSNDSVRLQLADAFYDNEDWDNSAFEFQRYLERHPDNPEARVDYAYVLTQKTGNLALGISEIDTVLTSHPDHLNGLINAGILSAQMASTSGKEALTKAKNYFQRARSVAEQMNPPLAARLDTLIHTVDSSIHATK